MWMLWLASVAFAGDLVVDAKVPAEIWIGGELAGQLAIPGEMRFQEPAGKTEVTVVLGARPNKIEVDVPDKGEARVLVGRTGITAGEPDPVAATDAAPAIPAAAYSVEFRSAGSEDMQLRLDDQRIALAPKQVRKVDLAPGSYQLSIRNESGTVVWARGTLDVGGAGLVVQVADGRMPELSGPGGEFHPDQR
jgi:hypothetical protein